MVDALEYDVSPGTGVPVQGTVHPRSPVVAAYPGAPTYKHQPLAPQEFRVLEILPSPDLSNGLLRCNIWTVSIEDGTNRPTYEAISYYWGDPDPCCAIWISDSESYLRLPVNSYKALKRMALTDRARTVYLDAVCINQADLEERAQQVQLMGTIFKNADATLVYVGDADDTTESAFENIRLLSSEAAEDMGESFRHAKRDVGPTSQKPLRSEIDRTSLLRLFSRPWFSRVWVVQEVAVAPTSRLICGCSEIDMNLVLNVGIWLMYRHWYRLDISLLKYLERSITRIWLFGFRLHEKGGLDITDVIEYSRYLETTDPRDKVFGMLGLLNMAELETPLTPEYTTPTEKLYGDVMRRSCKKSLYMLSRIPHLYEADLWDARFSSWIPRIDRSSDYEMDAVPGLPVLGRSYCLGDPNKSILIPEEGPEESHIIALQGVDLGQVIGVSEVFEGSLLSLPSIRLESIVKWHTSATDLLLAHQLESGNLSRTLIKDEDEALQRASADMQHGLSTFLACYHEGRTILSLDAITEATDDKLRLASRYANAMSDACKNRKFAVTSNGNKGIFPRLTQPSDVIVALHGAYHYMVLRPHGNEWKLVGDCYVDGYMIWQEDGPEVQRRLFEEEQRVFRIS